MIVIFANQQDLNARSLADRWAANNAAVLTARDLSREGWRYNLSRPAHGTAVIDAQKVAVGEIYGVLVRWPAVLEQELLHIDPGERTYVASEMTAFLRSWLTQLACPIMNRPTAGSLIGPCWRREQWVHVAARMGIPVNPVRRRAGLDIDSPIPTEVEDHVAVTVVGEHCFGNFHPHLAMHARRLAAAAGVTLLTAYFSTADSDALLLSADLLPDLNKEKEAVIDAVLATLLSARKNKTTHVGR